MYEKLNPTQKEMLSWIAFSINSLDNAIYDEKNSKMSSTWHENKLKGIEQAQIVIEGYRSMCTMCDIPRELIESVIDKKVFTGLRNHNTLSAISYYK